MDDVLSDMDDFDVEDWDDDDDINSADLEDIANATPIIRFVNVILYQAVRDQASDIHFEPFADEFKIRYRVDGVLYEMTPVPIIICGLALAQPATCRASASRACSSPDSMRRGSMFRRMRVLAWRTFSRKMSRSEGKSESTTSEPVARRLSALAVVSPPTTYSTKTAPAALKLSTSRRTCGRTIEPYSSGDNSGGAVWESLRDYDFRPNFKEIKKEVLIVHGTKDAIPVSSSEEIWETIEGSKLEVIDDVGHYPFIEALGLFTEIVTEFLRS